MNDLEQAFKNGFIKRAAQHGLSEKQANPYLDQAMSFAKGHMPEIGGAIGGGLFGAGLAGPGHRMQGAAMGALGGGALGYGAHKGLPMLQEHMLHNRNATNAAAGTDPVQKSLGVTGTPAPAQVPDYTYPGYTMPQPQGNPVQIPYRQ